MKLAVWDTISESRPSRVVAIGVLALLAFHGLWLAPARYDVDALLFLPGGIPVLAVVALSGWMVHGRRARLQQLARADSPWAASPTRDLLLRSTVLIATVSGAFVFFWATRTGKVDLLLPAMAAFVLAWAMSWRGASGLRAIALPAFVLPFGVRIPQPLEDELVWRLQLRTTESAAWLLDVLGREFSRSGVILHDGEHTFHVIDSCSGMNGIGILLMIALVVRDLFREAGSRLWLVVAAAPILGFALNAVRVAAVAASPDPEKLAGVEGDHTPQGLAVLMLGTLLLYGLGRLLALGRGNEKREPSPADGDGAGEEQSSTSGIDAGWNRLAVVTALVLGALALASFLIPRFQPSPSPFERFHADFPESKAGWTSGPAPHEPLFTGVFTRGFHRRYQIEGGPFQVAEIVDVLVGYEDPSRPDETRLMSSKALVPGPDWQLESERRARIWAIDREIELARASRATGSERALVHVWRPGDLGLGREAWRALSGIDASPWVRDRPRALVRLIVYAPHDGSLAVDRATQRLDRFVLAFRDELRAL